jgi:hypothetical protein
MPVLGNWLIGIGLAGYFFGTDGSALPGVLLVAMGIGLHFVGAVCH